ncbi:MAG: NOP5/NOP56 family protein, partial [Nitrososphaerales archaeon]
LFFVVSELGFLLLDEKLQPSSKSQFSRGEETKRFLDASSGSLGEDQIFWLKSMISPDTVIFAEPQLIQALSHSAIKAEVIPESDSREIGRKKVELIVASGLASNAQEAEEAMRNVSLGISTLRIREMSAKPDLQAMESVQALDEIDKTANILSSRVREWYGLHFPELTSMTDDNISLIKLVLTFKSRGNYDEGELEQMGYSKNKSKAIVSAAQQSRGAELREEDIGRIVQLAEEAQHLFSLRDKLATHVERTMRQVAPNVSDVAGASIGARLIARAGGLEKLAIMPASTIQILGAEKALYRALKSGSRPPKHGVLFQHSAVHTAPKWQRGKIARSIAGRIAIAARVDAYRGTREESVSRSLQERLDEIKVKYRDAPKERPQFVPQKRRFESGQGQREERRDQRRNEWKKPRKQRHRG